MNGFLGVHDRIRNHARCFIHREHRRPFTDLILLNPAGEGTGAPTKDSSRRTTGGQLSCPARWSRKALPAWFALECRDGMVQGGAEPVRCEPARLGAAVVRIEVGGLE